MSVNLRLLNLVDVDLNILLGNLLELLLKEVYCLAALTDDDTWSCSVDCHSDELESSLDNDLRERCLCKTA